MEVFLYNSTVCRLCGEENDNGTLLYSTYENNQSLNEIINIYLPLKVIDDGILPRTVCPGCTIQLEATVEFFNLIINGQKILRELYQREREYKKCLNNSVSDSDAVLESVIGVEDGLYNSEHPSALKMAGLEKPKRKRGRPPKKVKTKEDIEIEIAPRIEVRNRDEDENSESIGKRRRKAPTRFKEVVQGKELEKIFIEEGVTDGEDSDNESKSKTEGGTNISSDPEVIGHMETSGELVVVVKGKGRGRPKGRRCPTREECAICGMNFTCVGRYMSHVAQHGPVEYQCGQCSLTFSTRLDFTTHQQQENHEGQKVIQIQKKVETPVEVKCEVIKQEQNEENSLSSIDNIVNNTLNTNVPETLSKLVQPQVESDKNEEVDVITNEPEPEYVSVDDVADNSCASTADSVVEKLEDPVGTVEIKDKIKLKCSHCNKMFSSKQSRSLHIKAAHLGEKPYACAECGARFGYPRSLGLHAMSHRRQRGGKGYACDLCGKVLNHPSSVVYHKAAEHAGQRYVCNKCGKSFKHKQLLQRHQLVHSQARPFHCKICNASFKTKANLINHQLLHSGVKKYSCDICKHKFSHKTSLTLHMRWHTGDKPFACGTCGKCFSQKGNLSEHERTHSGERPYQCGVCSRRFTTSSQRRLHARRHVEQSSKSVVESVASRSGQEPARVYKCSLCPRTFARLAYLTKHNKQVHGKQISLLVTDSRESVQPAVVLPTASPEHEERVIYVAYDADASPLHVLDAQNVTTTLEENKGLSVSELYSGSSLLVQEHLEVQDHVQVEQEENIVEQPLDQLPDLLERIPVTDEQGNPLHFTMQDGTRLAITSVDGTTLQVVTHDGQTIPVEINNIADEDVLNNSQTIVHQLNLQKTIESGTSPSGTQCFTIV